MVARTGNISRRLRVPCWLGLFFLFPRHMTGGSDCSSAGVGSMVGLPSRNLVKLLMMLICVQMKLKKGLSPGPTKVLRGGHRQVGWWVPTVLPCLLPCEICPQI
jgi:hypothetical protein